MNRIILTMAVAVIAIGTSAISSPASAFLDTDCNGKQSCSDNSTDNSVSNTANGGAGGDGGSAIQGQQQGIFGSGNSRNTNRNTNKQGQAQGQLQGQGQGQMQGNVGLGSGNVTNVTLEGDDAADIPVSGAHAAALTSADDTCMGSTSAGFQGMSFGISFGSTWRDEDCVRRKDSRMFYNMQMKDVAVARMCQKADNRAAVEAAGAVCPGVEDTPVASADATFTVAEKTTSNNWEHLNDRDQRN